MSNASTKSVLLAALAVALLLAAPAGAEPIGFIAEAEGSVEVAPSGGTSFSAALADRDVSIGDTIRTGRDSTAKLVLVDDTIISIDEETELKIDEYVVGPSAQSEPSKVELIAGHVRTKVGEAFGGPTRLELHTPTAVIGVKGTEWLTWYMTQLEATYVCVLSGLVTMESNDPAVAGSYEPPVGGCARVLPHARPEPADLRQVGSAKEGIEIRTESGATVSFDTPYEPGDIIVEPPNVGAPPPPPAPPAAEPEPPRGVPGEGPIDPEPE